MRLAPDVYMCFTSIIRSAVYCWAALLPNVVSFALIFGSFLHLYKRLCQGREYRMAKANFFSHKGCTASHSYSNLSLSCYCSVILKMAQCSSEKHQSPNLSKPSLRCLYLWMWWEGAGTKDRSHLPDFIMRAGLSLASILDVSPGRKDVGKKPGIKNTFWIRIILTGQWQRMHKDFFSIYLLK